MIKKVFLTLFALVGLMCNQALAQLCDTVRLFPWDNDFYSDFGCWEQLGDSSSQWQLNADDTYNFVNAAYIAVPSESAANGCVLVSPALALPADTSNMLLSFKTRRMGTSAQLRVLVSTGLRENLAGYDTLLSVTPSGNNSYEVDLSAYAGQTVYVAFSIVKPTQSYNLTFFGVGSVNIISDHMPQGEWWVQNMPVRTGDTVEHEFDLTHGIENDSNTLFVWHSTMVEAGLATMVEVVTDMYLDYTTGTGRTLPRSIYRLIYHSQGTDTLTLTVSNIYGTITTQSVSRIYDCQPIATFPTVLEYNLIALCGYGDNLYPYNTSSGGYTFSDEDGGIYTNTIPYMRSNVNNGYRGYVVTPRIVVPAEGDPVSLMLRYRHGPLEVRATTADVTDTALFTDLLYTEPGSSFLRTRKVSLTPYAGDTVRLAIIHKGGNILDIMPDINVDYDTLPKIATVQVPSLATVGDTALCTATLRYGATDGLHYTWTSKVGGVITTNALGDSAWVSYSAGFSSTEDTITVVAANAYGADTVVRSLRILDCTPQLVLPWKETFSDGITCWYKPEGSNWTTGSYYGNEPKTMASSCNNSPAPHWIMSKAVVLPADTTLGVRLFWDAATTYTAYQQNCGVYVTTAADYTDTANYTLLYLDTAYHPAYTAFEHLSVPLTAYAGQTVHVAFRNMPYNFSTSATLHIDNVTIRTTVEPIVSLAATTQALSHEPVTHTATLTEGSPNGLTITWHSTLMDTTWVDSTLNSQLSTFNLIYTLGGRDTITVTASNIYGSSSATATVSVTDCTPIATLPWLEDFNNVAAVAYNAANGKVPNCWNRYWNGSDAKYTPHVISSYPYNPISGYVSSSNRALLLQAGTTAGYDSVAMVESPAFDVPLNGQLLSFYYMHESASYGTLSVGYLQDGAFVGVADMEPQAVGRTDTVSLQAIPAGVNRFALQWKSTWYGVIVDDIRVFAPDTLPTVRMEAPTQIFVGDTTIFRAILTNGLTDGLSFTWHSTLTGATYNSPASYFNIVYTAEGVDTVTVTAANAYGADSATVVVTVGSHPLPQVTVTGSSSLMAYDNTATFTATINDCSRNGLTCTWHSTLMDSTWVTPVQPSSTSTWQLVYTQGGLDTITCTVSNAYGTVADTTWCNVTNCYVFDVPYNEGFEMFNAGYTLPTCWQRIWNGTAAANYGPCILASGAYPFASHGSKVLMMKAGSSNNNYDTVAYAVLPQFEDSLTDLTLSFWYGHESVNRGTLTVGYLADSLFTPIADMTAVGIAGRRDTVSFSGVTADGARMALRWRNNLSVYAVAIDSLSVFVDNSFHAPRNLRVDSVGAQCVTLAWTPVENATAYHVTVDGAVDTVVSGAIATVCGLGPNTQYSASVAAISGSDTSSATTVAFTTLCHIADLPWFEDFQGSSPLACWNYSTASIYGTGIQIESGRLAITNYDETNPNSSVLVYTPLIEAPANELLITFTTTGNITAGILPNVADTSSFIPLIDASTAGTYMFDTRSVGFSDFTTIAFLCGNYTSDTTYNHYSLIDDLTIEQLTACARLRSVASYSVDARTAVVEWQYDTASAVPNTGVLITLTDLTDSSIAPIVTDAVGNSHTFNGLPVGHRYLAGVQALCADDTTVALTTFVVPTASSCAEVTGPYNSGWFLMNCDRPYSYSQSLYPAVLAASVDTLFGIAYHLTSSSVEQYPTSYNTYSSGPRLVDVYIGQTTSNTLSTPVSASNLTLAVQNFELPVSDTGWVHINFTTPVPLDGVSNLIVTLDDNTGAVYGDVEFSHHTADIGTCFRTSSSSYSYTQTYDPYNPAGFNPSAGTQIPDIQLLGGCSGDRCLQPIATVIDETENSVTLAWSQRGSETQWQVEYHIDGDSAWTIAGTTYDTVYTVSGLVAATGYRLRVVSICTDTVYGDILSAHTQCGTVSLPYHQTFRNYDMPNNQSHISEGGIPCWQTGNITLLSQGRGLWNTHQNGDFIISPEIGSDLSLVRVTLSASGSTFFNAGIKVGVCDSMGSNLVWLDTITLSDSAQDYIVHLNNYTGSDHHLAIGGSYESWTLYDVLLEQAANCLPVHHIALSHLDDESISFCWPPIDASHSWAIYLDGTLIATTSDTSYALSGLMSNTEYHLGVREICGVGDTSVFTTLAVTTLCSTSLPYGEDFESYAHNSLPDCWYLDERPHTGSSHNAWILSNASTDGELRMGDHYSPYEVVDTLPNYICSPMLQVGNHSVSISVVVSNVTINWGSCQVGIMTNAADTDSFIALATITPTITDTLYQLSTIGMTLPAKYALAFRWYGYTYCSVDDINVTIVNTINLAVNDSAMGSVSGAGTYEDGSIVTITATPNDGYHFVMWSDSVIDASRQVTLRGDDITLTAYFAPDTVWRTVTVSTNVPGAAEPYGSGLYPDGSTVEIGLLFADTVTHGGYWLFLGWSDGGTDNPRDILVTSDTAIVALFEWVPDSTEGINELSIFSSQFSIYPNPASKTVTVETDQPSTLTLTDATGRVCGQWKVENGKTTLDISPLPAGVYFVRISTSPTIRKLIIR